MQTVSQTHKLFVTIIKHIAKAEIIRFNWVLKNACIPSHVMSKVAKNPENISKIIGLKHCSMAACYYAKTKRFTNFIIWETWEINIVSNSLDYVYTVNLFYLFRYGLDFNSLYFATVGNDKIRGTLFNIFW